MRLRRREAAETTMLYYASDVHGSDVCWRKFLGAANHYRASVAIMGGDLTGKAIVPITVNGDERFHARFNGAEVEGSVDSDLDQFLDTIRFNGIYPWVAGREDVERFTADRAAREELFDDVMIAELRRWIELADDRTAKYDIETYVIAGNDDPWSCDEVLETATRVVACDDRIVIVNGHEMISCSYANPTPWRSPRELPENELYERIDRLAQQLECPESAIFNLHVPPYDSGLDIATKLTDDFTPVFEGGQPKQIPVGSRAVRQLIEEYQPMLTLHGHIHESRGQTRIGRTVAINSGSEYSTGYIHGVVVKVGESDVLSHQFTVG
jgi:uncharacterized protein